MKPLSISVLILLAATYGCKDGSTLNKSENSGLKLISRPGIEAAGVSSVHLYKMTGEVAALGSLMEIENRATVNRKIDHSETAVALIGAIRSASLGQHHEIPDPKAYKIVSSWHMIIYLRGQSNSPIYWILQQGESQGEKFYWLIYDPAEGHSRVLRGLRLEVLEEMG